MAVIFSKKPFFFVIYKVIWLVHNSIKVVMANIIISEFVTLAPQVIFLFAMLLEYPLPL
jgi:hypothetical protein